MYQSIQTVVLALVALIALLKLAAAILTMSGHFDKVASLLAQLL